MFFQFIFYSFISLLSLFIASSIEAKSLATCTSVFTYDGSFSLLTSNIGGRQDGYKAEDAISKYLTIHLITDFSIRNEIRDIHLRECHPDYYFYLHGPVVQVEFNDITLKKDKSDEHESISSLSVFLFQKFIFENISIALTRFCTLLWKIPLDSVECEEIKTSYSAEVSKLELKPDELFMFENGYITYPIYYPNDGGDHTHGNVRRLDIYYGMRVEDAVDDFFLDVNDMIEFHKEKRLMFLKPETYYTTIYSHLCDKLRCDGLPPREVVSYIPITNHFDATTQSFIFSKYYLRSGYSASYHVNTVLMRVGWGSEELLRQITRQVQLELSYVEARTRQSTPATLSALALAADTDGARSSSSGDEEVGISIGHTCEAGRLGKMVRIRKSKQEGYLTCPFDLLYSNYEGLLLCIDDEFKYFTDIRYLKLIEIAETHEPLDIVKGQKIIYHTRYNFAFVHESPGHANEYIKQNWSGGINHFIDNDYKQFCLRYNKRVKNFYHYINSGKRINFIINPIYQEYPHLHTEFPRFDALMKRKFPSLSYRITAFPKSTLESDIFAHEKLMNTSLEFIY